jgi:ABC-type glycerol-3-phosphate transport system permease component
MDELFRFPPRFLVQNPTFNNFSDLFSALNSKTVPFTRYVANRLFIATTTVLFTVIVSSMGAYALAKLRPRGTAFFSTVIIAALMFSGHVTLIPNYMVVTG